MEHVWQCARLCAHASVRRATHLRGRVRFMLIQDPIQGAPMNTEMARRFCLITPGYLQDVLNVAGLYPAVHERLVVVQGPSAVLADFRR